MTFANDTIEALESAVYLANSELEPDTLTTLADLRRFFSGYGYTGPGPTEKDLARTRDPGSSQRTIPRVARRSRADRQ